MPTKTELREVADGLAAILERVEAGELDAPPGFIARLEGARAALLATAEPERPGPRSGNPTV